MRFLADENVHADLVVWMREQGHDVSYVAELHAGANDETVLRVATAERRIVVTDDKGFGEMVVRRGLASSGVLLFRLSDPSVAVRVSRLSMIWPTISSRLAGSLTVVSDRGVRIRPLHPPG